MRKSRPGDRRRRRIRLRLLRLEGACFYCGRTFAPGEWATLDHLIPCAAGGSDDRDNLRLCCWRCNQRKGDGPLEGLAANIRRGCGLRPRHEIAALNRKAANRIAESRRREMSSTSLRCAPPASSDTLQAPPPPE